MGTAQVGDSIPYRNVRSRALPHHMQADELSWIQSMLWRAITYLASDAELANEVAP